MTLTAAIADRRVRRVLSVLVLMALSSGMVVAAVRAEGYRTPEFDLHDGGVWITKTSAGQVGRMSTEVAAIDVLTEVGGSGVDVLQFGSNVLVTTSDLLRQIDVRTAEFKDETKLPVNAMVVLGGPTAAVLDPNKGSLWIAQGDRVAGRSFDQDPTATVKGATSIAAGIDGVVHVLVPDAHEVVRFRPDGSELDRTAFEAKITPSEITAVGGDTIALDPSTGTLVLPGGRLAEISGIGDELRLQAPGPANRNVLVASNRGLVLVDTSSGSAQSPLTQKGTGRPAQPIRSGDCAFGVWNGQPMVVKVCGGTEEIASVLSAPQQASFRFRTNRNRVVLNEQVSGDGYLLEGRKEVKVDNWADALRVEQKDDGGEDPNAAKARISQNPQDDKPSEANQPPVAVDDNAAARPGRPVIIRVLDNDEDPDGDVIAIEPLAALDPEVGVANIVGEGKTVQFRPATGSTQPAEFEYTITDGRGESATAKVTVEIHTDGNAAPIPGRDAAIVEAGRSIVHNVLANDIDPDGDALALVGASSQGVGVVQYRADGTVVFNAPSTPGPVIIGYDVSDESGLAARGELQVDVKPAGNQKPKANNDHVITAEGREAVLNVLANDLDPNGDELVVARVENPYGELSVQWVPRGEMRVKTTKAGTYNISYEVTDGPELAKGNVRVDVQPQVEQRPPVAVRDDIVLRPGVAITAPVLANDVDANGDVLVIQSVTDIPRGSGLIVETIDHRFLRITATRPLPEAVTFHYEISDGTAMATGEVIAREAPGAVNQAPVTARDEVTVRAGNVTAIRVLANDIDPDGDEVRLVGVTPIEPGDGVLFVQGQELRYQAPPEEKGAVVARYTVEDTVGNRADGELVVHVSRPDPAENSPPAAPTLEARVTAGGEARIRVPLVGLDPEGDTVTFLGIGDAPTRGSITETGPDSFSYRADEGKLGTDRFTYRLRDQIGAEATGTVQVGVIAAPGSNSPPVAVPDRATVPPGESVAIDVLKNDSDPDGEAISLVIDDPDALKPRLGSVRIAGDVLEFSAGDMALDSETSFEYVVADERGATARGLATVRVTDQIIPRPPIARDDLVPPQSAGALVEVDVLANDDDPDGDPARLEVDVAGQPGVSSASDGRVSFTMGDKPRSFPYTVTDEQGLSARAFVQVPLVVEEDLPPSTQADRVETDFEKPVEVPVLDNDSHPQGKELKVVKVSARADGTAEIKDEKVVVFTPRPEFAGDTGFAYEVSDGKNSAQGSAVVVVGARANRPPLFTTVPVELPAGGTRTVDLLPSVDDPDSIDKGKHTFSGLEQPPSESGITGSLSGTTLTVTTSDGAKGKEADLRFQVDDGRETGAVQGSVRVRVLSSDKPPPQAIGDILRTYEDMPAVVAVLANDLDPVGKGLTIRSVEPGKNGRTEIQGEKVQFIPNSGFFGQTSFSYRIADSTNEAERETTGTVSVTVIGRPSAPPAPTGTPQSKAVSLTWAVPAANGAPISNYEVQAVGGSVREASSNSFLYDGLTNGTTYRFQVRAVNEAGKSGWSAQSVEVNPDTRPGAPAAPTAKFGDAQIELTWTAPVNEGTPISAYVVEVSPGPAAGTPTQTVSGTTYTWTGLTNGTAYRFRLKARNEAGDSEVGPYSSTEIPAGVPSPPAAPTATRGDQQATVQWSEPNINGDAIQSYDLVVKKGGVQERVEHIADPTSRQMVVTSLENGATYTFAIQAKNKAGSGLLSPDSSPAKPAGSPAPVAGVDAGDDSDRSSALTFTAPSSNGEPITSYKYRIVGGSAQDLAGDRIVRGLTNGELYRFEVQACNIVACGDFGPSSTEGHPGSKPEAPSVSGVVNGQSLDWNWNTPYDNGRQISRFDVYLDGTLVQQGMATSYSRGVGYSESHTLEVAAVNILGVSQRGSRPLTTGLPPDLREVILEKGSSAQGRPGCSSSICKHIVVRLRNFPANANYEVHCSSPRFPGDFCSAPDFPIGTNGSGNADSTNYYYYGYCDNVTVTVAGKPSNTVYWC